MIVDPYAIEPFSGMTDDAPSLPLPLPPPPPP
eukprot:SAG31_NODE_14846_length_785_cov_0.717201_1_plen_31_part_10